MRLKSLDAVRGLACLTVVISHCWLAAGTGWDFSHSLPLMPIAYGRPAVIIFFVLSGFVLSLPFLSLDPPRYSVYLIRRFCRIYLPFAAAISLSLAAFHFTAQLPFESASGWVKASWITPLTPGVIAGHFLMTGLSYHETFDNVMWSLVHELRISIIFPLLVYAVRWNTQYALLGSLAMAGIVQWLLSLMAVSTPIMWAYNFNLLTNGLITAYFVPFFILGIAISKRRAELAQQLQRVPVALRMALLPLGWLAFAWPISSRWADLFYASAAAGIISLALASRGLANFLEFSPFLWLGRVSYSLYLIHVPILLAALHLCSEKFPIQLTIGGAVVVALVGSEFVYRYIEAPAIRLGRHLTAISTQQAVLRTLQRR